MWPHTRRCLPIEIQIYLGKQNFMDYVVAGQPGNFEEAEGAYCFRVFFSLTSARPLIRHRRLKFSPRNMYQIICVASLGWGKGCIRFLCRLDQNAGFHSTRKRPLTYNGGKRCLYLFSVVFDPIFFKLAGKEDRHKISNKFKFWPDRTTSYEVMCPWASKTFPIDYNGKMVSLS